MIRLLKPLCLAVLLTTRLAAEAGQPIPVAQPLPDDQVFAVIVIPDLRTMLEHCEAIAGPFAPDGVRAGDLARRLGGRLGDAGLTKLGDGPVVVVMAPGGMAPATGFLIPSSEPELHAAALRRANLQAEVVGGLVAGGRQANDLALAKRMAPTHGALAAVPTDSDVRVLLSPSRLVAAYKPMLAGLTKVMAGQMARQEGGAQMARIVELELQGLLLLASDIDVIQVDVQLSGEAVGGRLVLAPHAGSPFAAACTAPPAALAPAPAMRLGPETGWMVCTGRVNSAAINGWCADLMTTLQQTPEGKDFIPASAIATIRGVSEVWDGGMAMRARSIDGNPMHMDVAMGCNDGARMLAFQRDMMAALFGDTALGEMYRAMGMSGAIEENVRQSGAVAVHRVHYELDETKMKPGEVEQLRAMTRDVEFAQVDGLVVMSQRPVDLDRLIAGTAGELPTSARQVHGAGRDGYVDFDLLGLMRALAATPGISDLPFAAPMAALPAGEAATLAWTVADGRGMLEWRFPLKPVVDMTNTFREQFGAGAGEAPMDEPEQPVF